MNVSVVIPVYNSEKTLEELVTRLREVLTAGTECFEIVLVNDGSSDRSWDIIERLSRTHEEVLGINLMRNYGQHNALLCGIRVAAFETVVTMDDDLQHPPEAIPRLLEKLEEGFDVVYGAPEKEPNGLWRGMASQIIKVSLRSVMGADSARYASAFRAFRTGLREAFADYRSPFVSIDVLLTWGTKRFSHVDVRHEERNHGRSNYTVRSLIVHAINMVTGFSTLPLQIASIAGFSLTLFGFVLLCYVLGRYLSEGGSVPGFPFLASIIIIFSGAQLFSLGVLGEYLARIYHRTMQRPVYIQRSSTCRQDAHDMGVSREAGRGVCS